MGSIWTIYGQDKLFLVLALLMVQSKYCEAYRNKVSYNHQLLFVNVTLVKSWTLILVANNQLDDSKTS